VVATAQQASKRKTLKKSRRKDKAKRHYGQERGAFGSTSR